MIAGAYTAETIAVTAAARMLEVHPTVRIRLGVANWAELPRLVREREAAIAIGDLSELGERPTWRRRCCGPCRGSSWCAPATRWPRLVPSLDSSRVPTRAPVDLARIMAWPFVFLGRIPRRVQEPLVRRGRRRGSPGGGIPPSRR